ncbi:MAG TPA: hypothetical protein VH859_02965 [Candidatus Limnocylindria bacterium]
MSILDLPGRIERLPDAARERIAGLFTIELVDGRTDPPPDLHAWLERQFGSVGAVRRQRVLRVTNRWTGEGSLFSPLRGRRPVTNGMVAAWQRQVEESRGDPFCDPERQTPADTWGRVRGERMITGANAAMYDAHHGVVVFAEHDPLAFDEALVRELLDVGRAWAERSHEADDAARNYLLIWNCGPRAGGSMIHGHAQVLLGRGRHYPLVERVRRDALAYRAQTGGSYRDDLEACHRDLGLVVAEADGVTTYAALAPVKERELVVAGPPGMDERDPSFADAVARLVVTARDALGLRAFNLALHRPPLAGDGWEDIGPAVHLVDRGDPGSTASDIGAMELYAAAVIGSDPFDIAERLRAAFAAS